jgi:hypothetical protein
MVPSFLRYMTHKTVLLMVSVYCIIITWFCGIYIIIISIIASKNLNPGCNSRGPQRTHHHTKLHKSTTARPCTIDEHLNVERTPVSALAQVTDSIADTGVLSGAQPVNKKNRISKNQVTITLL